MKIFNVIVLTIAFLALMMVAFKITESAVVASLVWFGYYPILNKILD